MKFYCIADENTVRGFRLAGVTGEVASATPAAIAAVQSAAARPDCGLIILTEKTADDIRPLVEQIRSGPGRPLIVEIPGPEGATRERKSLRQLVQEAIGIRLEPEKEN